jgi:hypothetical protein
MLPLRLVLDNVVYRPRSRPELKIRKGLRQQLLQLVRNAAHVVSPVKPIQVTHERADATRADYFNCTVGFWNPQLSLLPL